MINFRFNAEDHSYFLGDRRLFSVTQALVKSGYIDTQWFNEFAAFRGTAVHHGINLDINNQLDRNSIHDLIDPYMQAWFAFKRDAMIRFYPDLCEKPMYHPAYYYAGTPDIFCKINGGYAIVDIKTGEAPWADLQTAAYAHMPVFMPYDIKRFSLRLRPDGQYRLKRHSSIHDFPKFLQALSQATKE